MSVNKNANKWLLHFKKPSKAVYYKLQQLFASIEFAIHVDNGNHKRKDVSFEGELCDLMNKLFIILDQDYLNNLAEAKSVPWSFDYVVIEDKRYNGAIQVLTRFYSSKKSGNIFYGRLIKRVGETKYLMWIDD